MSEPASKSAEALFHAFLYEKFPGVHTYRVCQCGLPGCVEATTRVGRCAESLARELQDRFGIDVCSPQWKLMDDGRIRTLWHPAHADQQQAAGGGA